MPDWAAKLLPQNLAASQNLLNDFKQQAHAALDLFDHLKQETEKDLSLLKQYDPFFNPSTTAAQTTLSSIFSQVDMKNPPISSVFQNWEQMIRAGHENIDRTFVLPLRPQLSSSPQFLEQAQLGLQIIGKGLMDHNFDPNLPLKTFLEKEKIPAIHIPDQTVRDFLENTTKIFKQEKEPCLTPPHFLQGIPSLETSPKALDPLKAVEGSPSSFSKSRGFTIEGSVKKDMLITFINGMGNSFKEAQSHAQYLQQFFSSKPSIQGVYNHSNTFPIDLGEIWTLNYNGFSPVTADLLKTQWTAFHEQNQDAPDAKILHFCHSQGAIHTKNALSQLSEEIRNRIIVVAIAPAAAISKNLCNASFNYASEKDFIPYAEPFKIYVNACEAGKTEREEMLLSIHKVHEELILLKPHEGASG